MTDINTNNSSVTNNEKKSKQELKQEEREKYYEVKLEENRAKQIAKLEKKKAKLTVKLNQTQNPSQKGRLEDKIKKVDEKINDLKDPSKAMVKRPFGLVMRTWFKGLGKETGRITWYKKGEVIKDFVTIILVCAFLAVIFFAIDMIVIALGNI